MYSLKGKSVLRKTLVMLMVLALLLPSAAMAEELSFVEVGYDGAYAVDGVHMHLNSEVDVQNNSYDFSVTNAVETFDASEDDYYLRPGINVDGSTVVTLLKDNALEFGVYKLTDVGDNQFELDSNNVLPIDGQISFYGKTDAVDEEGNPVYASMTIDITDMENHEMDMYYQVKGNTVSITEPGHYFVNLRYEAAAGAAQAIIVVPETQEAPAEEEPVEEEPIAEETVAEEPALDPLVNALPTSAKVLVNGEEVSFNAYNINGNNYFKLRDLATAVSGSVKQFQVEWDNEVRAINLISGQAYTSVGGEMTSGDGEAKEGTLNTSKIYKDGEEIQLSAYTINDNNFFKLRDVAEVFDIGVTWDGETKTIGIDTSVGYTAE